MSPSCTDVVSLARHELGCVGSDIDRLCSSGHSVLFMLYTALPSHKALSSSEFDVPWVLPVIHLELVKPEYQP